MKTIQKDKLTVILYKTHEEMGKAAAGEIGEYCPATILRVLDGSTMYCDADSAGLLG